MHDCTQYMHAQYVRIIQNIIGQGQGMVMCGDIHGNGNTNNEEYYYPRQDHIW